MEEKEQPGQKEAVMERLLGLPEDEEMTAEPDRQEEVEEPQEPTPEPPSTMSLQQFCTAMSMGVPVESLSVFFEVQSEEGHYQGTYEQFQQWLREFMNQPL